jgi:hypothetical protein
LVRNGCPLTSPGPSGEETTQSANQHQRYHLGFSACFVYALSTQTAAGGAKFLHTLVVCFNRCGAYADRVHLRAGVTGLGQRSQSNIDHHGGRCLTSDRACEGAQPTQRRAQSAQGCTSYSPCVCGDFAREIIGRWALFMGGPWPPKQGREPVAIKARHARRIRGKNQVL